MTEKWTLGEWQTRKDGGIDDHDGYPILKPNCESRGLYHANVRPNAEFAANATLASSSPDLYAACFAALSCHDVFSTSATPRLLPEIVEKLRAALAKANGETK